MQHRGQALGRQGQEAGTSHAAQQEEPRQHGLEPLTKPSWHRCLTLPYFLYCLRSRASPRALHCVLLATLTMAQAHARAGSATSDRWQAAMQANRAGHGYLAGGFYRTHKSAIAFLALMTRRTMHRLVLFGGIGPARWVFVSVVCDLRAASRGIMTEGVPPHPFRHLPDSCPSPPNRHKAGRAIYVAHPARVGHCSLHCSDRRQTGFAGAGKSLPP